MLNASLVPAQFLPPGDHRTTVTSSYDGTKQPYRLFVPKRAAETSAALPLVVVLHGHGADQNAWFDFTPVKHVAEEYGYVVVSPLARGNWWYRGPAERDVLDIIADVQKSGQIDPNRAYLAGHSMGGWGTWWIGLRHADVFAAICPMSGFPPGEMIRNARNLAPFVIHDSLDDIVPVENSRMPVELLAHFGISHEYREETGYAHSSKLIGDNLPRVFEWFNQHPRVARPKHVAIVSRTPLAGEAYWLKLIGTSAYPKQATLDAFVDTTGNLTIRADGVKKFAVNLDALPTSASEPLKVTLGGGSFVAEKKRGWAVFENDGGASWTLKIGSIELPEPQKPLTGEIIEKLKAAAGNQDKLAEIVASLLMKETGAQACVLDAEKFKLPPGDLTGDMILELSAYPDERLAVFECPASALAKAHEAISKKPINVFPPGTTTKGNVSTRVVMPVAIAKQFPKYDETRNVFPELVGDLLYRVSSK